MGGNYRGGRREDGEEKGGNDHNDFSYFQGAHDIDDGSYRLRRPKLCLFDSLDCWLNIAERIYYGPASLLPTCNSNVRRTPGWIMPPRRQTGASGGLTHTPIRTSSIVVGTVARHATWNEWTVPVSCSSPRMARSCGTWADRRGG